MKAVCSDPKLWRGRYEALRAQAAAGNEAGVLAAPPMGMYLMSNYGVAWWMRRWAEPGGDCATGSASAGSSAPLPVELAPAWLWREQLTVLLAQMTFQHLRTG